MCVLCLMEAYGSQGLRGEGDNFREVGVVMGAGVIPERLGSPQPDRDLLCAAPLFPSLRHFHLPRSFSPSSFHMFHLTPTFLLSLPCRTLSKV